MKSWSLAVIAAVLGCVFSSPEASAADKLSKVFKLDMLNVQPAFLESVAGPAKEINKDANGVEIRRYLIDGCDVAAHFEGSRARRYSLSLTPKCNFNLGGFVPGYSSTKGLTIGKFVDGPQHPKMRMHSFCIYSCGNAA